MDEGVFTHFVSSKHDEYRKTARGARKSLPAIIREKIEK